MQDHSREMQRFHELLDPHESKYRQAPRKTLLSPSHEEVIDVGQREYSFSRGSDPRYKRYIETSDLVTCVGLVVYDPQTAVGCVGHIDNDAALKPDPKDMWPRFVPMLKYDFQQFQSPGPYVVSVIGGFWAISNPIYIALFETLPELGEFKIQEIDIRPEFLLRESDSRSIILDLNDGEIYAPSLQVIRSRTAREEILDKYIITGPDLGMHYKKDERGL